MKPIIIIPSRLDSTRLPNKPLADINGKPMIIHVLERAKETNIDRVVVACADQEIKDIVEKAGGEAVITPKDLPSGSDSIMAALNIIDPKRHYDVVVYLQGILPTIDPEIIDRAYALLDNHKTDIGTLATPIKNEADKNDPNIVKTVAEIDVEKGQKQGRAMYFTRSKAPYGEGDLFRNIGIYVYRRDAIEKFISSPPSYLEKRENLEQLRALTLGMRIDVAIIDDAPIGVRTEEDLEKIRNEF